MPQQMYSANDITTCLMALAAWSGSPTAAARYLEKEKSIKINPATLNGWKQVHGEEYDDIRSKYGGQMEERLAHEMREAAGAAADTMKLAIETARTQLENGRDQDPGRTAANLARAMQSSTDKLLSLTGRPSQITVTRDAAQILRKLASLGVLELPEGDVAEPATKSNADA